MRQQLRSPFVLTVALGVVLALTAIGVFAETINPFSDGSKYGWGENVGWLNAEPSGNGGPGVTVSGTKLTGYMWGENIGWINMSCENNGTCGAVDYGVTNDGAGHLAGYAWGENVGWISFSCQNNPSTCASTGNYGVSIDPATGIFSGYAWGENIGWISFSDSSPVSYRVQTDDGDGVNGASDNCAFDYNPSQENTDSACIPNGASIPRDCRANPNKDPLGDACDTDRDNDGLTDAEEAVGCGSGPTDPLKKDTDGDRAIDGYECKMGTDPNNPADRPYCAGSTDTDGDGIFDCVEEMGYGTSPLSTDTDGDSSGNDGCQDDKQIVDVNGDGQANILDVFAVARIALLPGSYDPVSQAAADIDKDGVNSILDVMIAAKNSNLVESHSACA